MRARGTPPRRYFHCCRHCGWTPSPSLDAWIELHGEEANCLQCGVVFERIERGVHALMQVMEVDDHDEVIRLAGESRDAVVGHKRPGLDHTWLTFYDIDARLYVSKGESARRSLWRADKQGIYRLVHDIGQGAVNV